MTKRELARTADAMIGAAQVLEVAAKRLKAEARNIRAGSLSDTIDASLWRDHKVADVKRAAEKALDELGVHVLLTETEHWDAAGTVTR
jgi:hypothetical protein